jgi:hypothetical protein
MSMNATIQELARQVRRDTLQILTNAPADWLTYAPAGTSNHILWHAGHAVWLQDLLCVQLLAGSSELSAQWSDWFGMNCRPPSETTAWPAREELIERLQNQLQRVLELLSQTADEQLLKIANPSRGPALIRDRIIHGWHDEAKHCGEMYLLFKLCRSSSTR